MQVSISRTLHTCGLYCEPALSVHAWPLMAHPSYTHADVIETGGYFHPHAEILEAWRCEGVVLPSSATERTRDGVRVPYTPRADYVAWLYLIWFPPWYHFEGAK